MRSITVVGLAAAAILGINRAGVAEEWPRWMGPNGTGISAETTLADQWPEDGPKKVWSQPVGIGFSSPIAMDGKVYLFSQDGSKDVLQAFDAGSGKVLWSQVYERGADPGYPGARATPTIDGDRIYTHGSAGDLTCRQLADGKLVWTINILTLTGAQPLQWGSASSPAIFGDLIYVQSGGDAIAVAIEKQTGKVAWKSQANGAAGYATIIQITVNGRQQLIVFGGNAVYGMDSKNGKTIWSEPWETDYEVNAATPVFRDGRLCVTSDYGRGAMMLSVTDQGARKDWEKKDVMCRFQSPILDGAALYANSEGVLRCISWPSGAVLWSASNRNLNLGAGGSIVRNGDKLIAMSERGKLSLIHATPKEYKLISQASVFDYSQVWSTPLIYRGKLYAKGEAELVCLDISKPNP